MTAGRAGAGGAGAAAGGAAAGGTAGGAAAPVAAAAAGAAILMTGRPCGSSRSDRRDLVKIIQACARHYGHGDLIRPSTDGAVAGAGGYWPTRPSIRSRSRSAWPLCRAYSSIMCTITSRRAMALAWPAPSSW